MSITIVEAEATTLMPTSEVVYDVRLKTAWTRTYQSERAYFNVMSFDSLRSLVSNTAFQCHIQENTFLGKAEESL